MLKVCGSTLPALAGVGASIRRTLSSGRHAPAAAALVDPTTRLFPPFACTGGPRAQQEQTRPSSSSSRWKSRQENDAYAREAKVRDLKSRAAFKLLEIDSKYHIFKKGALVLDLGYAPGSWSQVAIERTKPTGRVLGIDLLPAQPPRGVAALQGNVLFPRTRKMARQLLAELHNRQLEDEAVRRSGGPAGEDGIVDRPSYIDMEHRASQKEGALLADDQEPAPSSPFSSPSSPSSESGDQKAAEEPAATVKPEEKKYVDVLLSDMSEPWPQTSGFGSNTLSNPYRRLMNTSGIPFHDHAMSIELCVAALDFVIEELKPGGHFVCKFYQGSLDKDFEKDLKKHFKKVLREKPEASRKESKELYFVALGRKKGSDLRERGPPLNSHT